MTTLMEEIKDLQQFFTAAQVHLRSGNVLNMAGMDERISAVCQAAQKASPDEQKKLLPELTVLIAYLSAYEQELRKAQATLQAAAAQEKSDDSGT